MPAIDIEISFHEKSTFQELKIFYGEIIKLVSFDSKMISRKT